MFSSEQKENSTAIHVIIILLSTVLLTWWHYDTALTLGTMHAFHQRLFLLIIVYAGLASGFAGGSITALLVSFLYAPHLLFYVGSVPPQIYTVVQEVSLFNITAWIVGGAVSYYKSRMHNIEKEVSDVKQQNQALRGLKSYLDNILQNIPAGVVVTNHKNQIIIANRKAATVLGVCIKMDHNYEAIERILVKHFLLGCSASSINTEVIVSVNNQKKVLSCSKQRFTAPTNEGCLIIFEDITHMKELEQRIRVSERLASLGRLVAGLMHEIRNPLGIIKANAQLALRYPQDNEDSLAIIAQEVDRLDDILKTFNDFAAPSKAAKDVTDIKELVNGLTMAVKGLKEAKHVVFETDVAENVPLIRTDNLKLRQVLLNLMLNSLQSMSNKQCARLSVISKLDDNQVIIDVEDTGEGILDEHRDHIFEPFYSTKEQGTGLGLSIAHRHAQELGGELVLADTSNEGTSFRLVLPLDKEDDNYVNDSSSR